ncbi:GNAT family N-acetyltransferase [Oscillochloris sp. ZM17-4]|uniref:GNAT family N-acetyltransferase n=1 Tax=Oscillochloris sp. ZM17-4 TaxID=2866714 RepID=UPI001C72D407|nr:GNAT family N-acetyltransferase [Oscillochloris sp. ZM17-4]MBX0330100.1 GNAT family N-acetyltransferase [Oscillochloris sp. ZM17-4]
MPPTLQPYPDSDVRMFIRSSESVLVSAPTHYRHEAPGGLVITATTNAGTWENLGPVIAIGVWRQDRLIGHLRVERDIEIEADEAWGPAWIMQSMFVLPEQQRQGVGTMLLHTARQLTGLPIDADTQMTDASSALYAKLRGELWPAGDSAIPTDDSTILAFRAEAERIIDAALAAWRGVLNQGTKP